MDRETFYAHCKKSLKFLADYVPTDLSDDGLRAFVKTTVSRYFAANELPQPIIQTWVNDKLREIQLLIEYPWERLHCSFGIDQMTFYRRAAEARQKSPKKTEETMKTKRFQLQRYAGLVSEPLGFNGAPMHREHWETIAVNDEREPLEIEMLYCTPKWKYRIVDTEKIEENDHEL